MEKLKKGKRDENNLSFIGTFGIYETFDIREKFWFIDSECAILHKKL